MFGFLSKSVKDLGVLNWHLSTLSLRVRRTRLLAGTSIRAHRALFSLTFICNWRLQVIILLIVLQNCPSSLSLKDTTRKIGAHTAIWCSFILNLSLYLSVQTCYWPTSWRNSCDFKQLINAACETWRVGYFKRMSLNQKKNYIAIDEVEHRMNCWIYTIGIIRIPFHGEIFTNIKFWPKNDVYIFITTWVMSLSKKLKIHIESLLDECLISTDQMIKNRVFKSLHIVSVLFHVTMLSIFSFLLKQ